MWFSVCNLLHQCGVESSVEYDVCNCRKIVGNSEKLSYLTACATISPWKQLKGGLPFRLFLEFANEAIPWLRL